MLSLSYGQTGREPNNPYDRHAIYNTTNPNQYIDNPIIIPQQVQLDNLKWQTLSSWNLGLDLAFFKNNLSLTGEVYSKVTEDLLWRSYPIPGHRLPTKWFNGGELKTRDGNLSGGQTNQKEYFTFNFNISQNINTFL